MISMLKYAFTHIFSLRILFLAAESKCGIERLFDHKPDKLLPQTLYRTQILCCIKVCEEDALNDALFEPLSNYRADRHIK